MHDPASVATDEPAARRLRAPLWIAAAAAFLYSNFLLDWVLRGFHGMTEVVSTLASPGEPNATLLRVTDVICAVLVLALLPWLRRALPRGWWREVVVLGTALFALGAIAAAVVPEPCGTSAVCTASDDALDTAVHGFVSVVSDTALFVGAAAAWWGLRRTGPAWVRTTAAWAVVLGGGISTIVFVWFNGAADQAWVAGISQRVHILTISAWIWCLGWLGSTPDARAQA